MTTDYFFHTKWTIHTITQDQEWTPNGKHIETKNGHLKADLKPEKQHFTLNKNHRYLENTQKVHSHYSQIDRISNTAAQTVLYDWCQSVALIYTYKKMTFRHIRSKSNSTQLETQNTPRVPQTPHEGHRDGLDDLGKSVWFRGRILTLRLQWWWPEKIWSELAGAPQWVSVLCYAQHSFPLQGEVSDRPWMGKGGRGRTRTLEASAFLTDRGHGWAGGTGGWWAEHGQSHDPNRALTTLDILHGRGKGGTEEVGMIKHSWSTILPCFSQWCGTNMGLLDKRDNLGSTFEELDLGPECFRYTFNMTLFYI